MSPSVSMTPTEKITKARALLEEARTEIPDAETPGSAIYNADFELGYAIHYAKNAETLMESDREERYRRDLL